MKFLLSIIFVLSCSLSFAVIRFQRINPTVFSSVARTDFNVLFIEDEIALKSSVKVLFELNFLMHEGTQAYDLAANFEEYFQGYKKSWHLVDLNNDGTSELLFSGLTASFEEKESMTLFVQKRRQMGEAFRRNWIPDVFSCTSKYQGEKILVTHQYPCCAQYTHTVRRLRYLNERLYVQKKYMVATDSRMKGDIFPDFIRYSKGYKKLKARTSLRWSSSKIEKDAFHASASNEVVRYEKGSLFENTI